MFFSNRIQQISKTDRVLEIGPGGNPHPRADVLLERRFNNEEAFQQRGGTNRLNTDKLLVFYEGGIFPFKDKEFDYVICSHVIEHVEDVEAFCAEMFRVAKRGYIEYPTIYYEYLFNFSVHKQLINFHDNTLSYLPKSETQLNSFQPVHNLFVAALAAGYSDLVEDIKHSMFQGFEWTIPFSIQKASDVSQLATYDPELLRPLPTLLKKLRRLVRAL
jgi:SAM-dependent methyltransferase